MDNSQVSIAKFTGMVLEDLSLFAQNPIVLVICKHNFLCILSPGKQLNICQ